MRSPIGQLWTTAYDASGNVASTVDANGNATPAEGDGTTSYAYNRAERLTQIDYSDATPDVSFAYDAVGNRTQMSDGAGTQTRTYDAVNRLTGVTRGPDAFTYAYDLAGNLTRRTYPGGTISDYTYDDDERMASVTSGDDTTGYAYDAAGNLIQTTLPTANGHLETRLYDRAGRLTEVKNAKGGSVLSRFVSTLDPVGNPTRIERTGSLTKTASYDYDANDRLTAVCYQTSCPGADDPFVRWAYDKVGNRLSEQSPGATTSYNYNAGDQLTQAGSTNYTYDANGNQTAAGTRTFAYDLANRLASTTAGGVTAMYTYDGDGNRAIASTGSQPSDTTSHVWDVNHTLPQLALERDGDHNLLRGYFYGMRRTSMTSGGAESYDHYDQLGSVTSLTSSSGGEQRTYAYEPFGNADTETGSAPANHFKFAGEYQDERSSLYYLRAREYEPMSGRFMSLDPAESDRTIPRLADYVYAADRPTVMVDPSGETFEPSDEGQRAVGDAASPEGLCFVPPLGFRLCKPAGSTPAPIPIPVPCVGSGFGISVPVPGVRAAIAVAIGLAIDSCRRDRCAKRMAKRIHHIVAATHWPAAPTRRILHWAAVSVQEPANLVELPVWFHERLHTIEYYTAVHDRVQDAAGPYDRAKRKSKRTGAGGRIRVELIEIGIMLRRGARHPFAPLTT